MIFLSREHHIGYSVINFQNQMCFSVYKSSLAPSHINLNKNSALFKNYQTFVSNPNHSVIFQFYMGTFYLLSRLQLPPGQVSSLPIPHHLENFSLPGTFSYSKEGTSFSFLHAFTWPAKKISRAAFLLLTFERKTHEQHVSFSFSEKF